MIDVNSKNVRSENVESMDIDEEAQNTLDDPDQNVRSLPAKSIIAKRGANNIRKFGFNLKKFFGFGKNLDDLAAVVKNADLGVEGVSKMVKDAKVTKGADGLLKIGNVPTHQFDDIVKSGNFTKMKDALGSTATVSAKDANAFKKLAGDYPASKLDDLDIAKLKNKTKAPELDIKSAADAAPSVKEKIKKIEAKSISVFKSGTKIALIVGVAYIGVQWLSKATEARKGCFCITVINGKSTSCRYAATSCVGGNDSNNCGEQLTAKSIINSRNVVLFTMYMAKSTKYKPLFEEELTKQGITDVELNANMGKLIQSPEKLTAAMDIIVGKMSEADKTQALPVGNICSMTHSAVEGGVVPNCRMCNPSAPITSTEYIDASNIADNMTFKCNANPTIIDTITDTIINTGQNILDWGSDLGKYVKYGIIGVILVVVVLVVIKLATVLFTSMKNKQAVMVTGSIAGPPVATIQQMRTV